MLEKVTGFAGKPSYELFIARRKARSDDTAMRSERGPPPTSTRPRTADRLERYFGKRKDFGSLCPLVLTGL